MLTPNSTWNAYCKCDRIVKMHKYHTQSWLKFQLDKQCGNKYRPSGTALPASVCSNFSIFALDFSNLNIRKLFRQHYTIQKINNTLIYLHSANNRNHFIVLFRLLVAEIN